MSTKNADSPPESKCCNCCGQRLPSAAFRRVYRDRDWPRHSECRDCRNAQDRRRRERSRRKSLRRQITALAAADNARQVKALAGAMVGAAGGFDRFNQQFAELWNGKLTPATQQRLFASVLNLAGSADEGLVAAVATPGGTGAIRQGLELIQYSDPEATVWLSSLC